MNLILACVDQLLRTHVHQTVRLATDPRGFSLIGKGPTLRHRMVAVSMPGGLNRLLSIVATRIVVILVVTTVPSPLFAKSPLPLADALPPGRQSCHALTLGATELAARPKGRVAAISFERIARDLAAERKWGTYEQFDDTPVISATLRVRLRGDPVTHSARLECVRDDDDSLVCTGISCEGGQIRVAGEGRRAIGISVGGALKSGQFVGHYLHLDDSCEGRPGGAIVLESGDDDRRFSLPSAPQEACR